MLKLKTLELLFWAGMSVKESKVIGAVLPNRLNLEKLKVEQGEPEQTHNSLFATVVACLN